MHAGSHSPGDEDLVFVRQVHAASPGVRMLLIGTAKEDGDFLQCVQAGISGFLWREASSDKVVAAVRAVQNGEAVCPGTLRTALSAPLPCAGVRQRLGFTRREQQLIPLIASRDLPRETSSKTSISGSTSTSASSEP
jgi:DNA-binding NarL/FixJ family response regulator